MSETDHGLPAPDWRLEDWLRYQERLHPRAIALGLDRVAEVARRLGLLPSARSTLTIGGTNGKGSSTTLAADIYRAAGYRVGSYTSPHLLHYNERVVIDGQGVDDAALCRAFAAIEAARGDVELTYFEFGTLAALLLFAEAQVDVQVLEVGLGGRLDAVNIVDADCALITNVGLDHTEWLGSDVEAIGFEKAGIMRAGRPAVLGSVQMPERLLRHARELPADLRLPGRDFEHATDAQGWRWRGRQWRLDGLPPPALPGRYQYDNAAAVIAAIEALTPRLPLAKPATAIGAALRALRLPGRLQRVGRRLYDVAHNAEAAAALAQYLQSQPPAGRRWLVFGMLSDKPVEAVARQLAPQVAGIFCGTLPPPRGLNANNLRERLAAAGIQSSAYDNVSAALRAAEAQAAAGDEIVVCGSFLTVAEAMGQV